MTFCIHISTLASDDLNLPKALCKIAVMSEIVLTLATFAVSAIAMFVDQFTRYFIP